jgi:23S rRNA pseudouridine1911/1915/1917 synthase
MAQEIEVLYEDNHLIAINKRAGDITQGDKTGDEPLPEKVKRWLKEKYDKPGNVFCGVIHRLDRPTSGLVMFAKTSKSLSRMNAMFQSKEVQKTYWAITEKSSIEPSGELVHYLSRNEIKNKSFASTTEKPGSKKAVLTYKILVKGDNYDLIEVLPQTGRHHQIRVQLSSIGAVIKGDLKYGAKRSNPDGGISLHARKVVFVHPVSQEEITIVAPAPTSEPLWQKLEKQIG